MEANLADKLENELDLLKEKNLVKKKAELLDNKKEKTRDTEKEN